MKEPIKRKKRKGQRVCPIDVDSLYRHWEWGDKRIDWPRIAALLERWENGEKIPWRKLSHTFIKPGRRVPRERPQPRRRRNRRQNDDIAFWNTIRHWLDETPTNLVEPEYRPHNIFDEDWGLDHIVPTRTPQNRE